jgi:hypothetical protein
MRTLRLVNLHCNKIDDDNTNTNTKLNKTFLTVDNGRFHIFGPESLMNGRDWKVNVDVQFNKQAKISFFDEDLVKNLSTTKHFRNYIVEENDIDDKPKKISFATSNANYVLTFEII